MNKFLTGGKLFMDDDQLVHLEKKLQYSFSDKELLKTALTHSSYANEHDLSLEHNERLEFLGDAVLELCISEELFNRHPQVREGGLTNLRSKLVSEATLAKIAKLIDLQEFIYLGRGEENQGGRERNAILCDSLEAILGAIFLDGGYNQAQKTILRLFKDLWSEDLKAPRHKDHKSLLQEITQKKYKGRPNYSLLQSYGPEHAKIYAVRLELPDGESFEAQASSVKKAEQRAAKKAVYFLEQHCLIQEQDFSPSNSHHE